MKTLIIRALRKRAKKRERESAGVDMSEEQRAVSPNRIYAPRLLLSTRRALAVPFPIPFALVAPRRARPRVS